MPQTVQLGEFDFGRDTDESGNETLTAYHRPSGKTIFSVRPKDLPAGVSMDSLTTSLGTLDEAMVGSSADSGPDTRPLIGNGVEDIFVSGANGDDSNDGSEANPLRTYDEAMKRIPIYVRHKTEIHLVPDGTNYGQIFIPPYLAGHYDDAHEVGAVIVSGEGGYADVEGVHAKDCSGVNAPSLINLNVTDIWQGNNEGSGIILESCRPRVRNISFEDTGNPDDICIKFYSSIGKVSGDIDVGAGRMMALSVKRGGRMYCGDITSWSGTLDRWFCVAASGDIHFDSATAMPPNCNGGESPLDNVVVGNGTVIDEANHKMWGPQSLSNTKVDAYLTANLDCPAGTKKTIPLDGTNVDELNDFNEGSGVFTAPVDGEYEVAGSIGYINATAGDRVIGYLTSESRSVQVDMQSAGGAYETIPIPTRLINLDAGDTITLDFQNTDNACDVLGNEKKTYLTITRA